MTPQAVADLMAQARTTDPAMWAVLEKEAFPAMARPTTHGMGHGMARPMTHGMAHGMAQLTTHETTHKTALPMRLGMATVLLIRPLAKLGIGPNLMTPTLSVMWTGRR